MKLLLFQKHSKTLLKELEVRIELVSPGLPTSSAHSRISTPNFEIACQTIPFSRRSLACGNVQFSQSLPRTPHFSPFSKKMTIISVYTRTMIEDKYLPDNGDSCDFFFIVYLSKQNAFYLTSHISSLLINFLCPCVCVFVCKFVMTCIYRE